MPEWLQPELAWFIVGLVFFLAEFAIPGLVIFFFGLGAWVVALVCLVNNISLNMQLGLFLLTSVVALAIFRKKLKSLFFSEKAGFENLEDTIDGYKGQKVKVVEAIKPGMKGKVEVFGTNWDAEADVAIPEGTIVEIVDKKNITLKVKIFE